MSQDENSVKITLKIPILKNKFFGGKKTVFIILGILFFFFFVVFSIPVKKDLLNSFDFDTTHILQNHTPLRLDPLFSLLSRFGNFETTSILLLVFLFVTQSTKIKTKGLSGIKKVFEFVRHPMAGFIVFLVFGAAHVVEVIGKVFLDHPGPPHMFLRTKTFDFPQLYVHTNGSYPSGHSMRMIFLFIVFTYIVFSNKKVHPFIKLAVFGFLVVYSGLMLYSRVSLGEHWTTDVIAGSLLGASFGFAALIFL